MPMQENSVKVLEVLTVLGKQITKKWQRKQSLKNVLNILLNLPALYTSDFLFEIDTIRYSQVKAALGNRVIVSLDTMLVSWSQVIITERKTCVFS